MYNNIYIYVSLYLYSNAGHVVHRTFKTDPVMRRVSSKLIETVNHEFYELIGDINDTKYG